ncbi:MAG TPA: nitrite/sulfite reductase [Chloroflexota bacterium]|nr:nitrite/sulfite reductase [Chloroflexota bacterium]
MPDAPTLDLVLRRNSIERLKRETFPLDVIEYLPDLIERGYEAVSEEDIVRLQWYGLYHDKPKVGYFMMRIKVPSGILSPRKLRTIGELAIKYSRDYTELSTRQNVQLHWIRLDHLPDVFATLEASDMSTVGGCGDTVRNITGCPVAGIDAEELFDARPLIDEAAEYFYGNREYCDLPRKHKISISTCAHQCNAPELNCISLIGTRQEGRLGYALWLGGGLSATPRIARHTGAFVPQEESMDVLRAILDAWRTDLKYRLSRVKARLKFMVDDYGGDGMRTLIEQRIGHRLADLQFEPKPVSETEHLGIHQQKQVGLNYVGFPVHLGQVTGHQMAKIADLAESVGGDVRLTRQQNFIIAGIPDERLDRTIEAVEEIGFSLKTSRLRATGIACTGEPLCNYAVAETKTKLDEIIQHLEQTFGASADEVRVHVDGCPHACAHHWTGDIGLQGTTARERATDGEKIQAYEIYLRGGLGPDAEIGKAVLRRVPSDQAKFYVERLIRGFLDQRQPGERFRDFCRRLSDDQLSTLAQTAELASSSVS